MNNKQFDYIIFIGRYQPFHDEHAEVLKKAHEYSDKVIVFIGSCNQPRSPKNPWVFAERKKMIEDYIVDWNYSFPCPSILMDTNLDILPLRDIKYNDQLWAAQVTDAVDKIITRDVWKNDHKIRIAIIGHSKDETSYYLKMFPQWKQIEHPLNENISATTIRKLYFEEMSNKFLKSAVPNNVLKFMDEFPDDIYVKIKNEYEFIKNYKKGWSVSPYPVKHVTVDALVVQSGHILLVTRKAAPGEGLIALPGGHLNVNERIVDGMIRELIEETKLKVPEKVLRGSIKKSEVFDAIDRSQIGRVITHAFLIELSPGELPHVKGSDDARKAAWYPISDLNDKLSEEMFFDDHRAIIDYFLGRG